jgi:hypothetical protein
MDLTTMADPFDSGSREKTAQNLRQLEEEVAWALHEEPTRDRRVRRLMETLDHFEIKAEWRSAPRA